METPVVVDENACTGCGACVRVCPSEVLALDGGTVRVLSGGCMECGHCEAACPVAAVRCEAADAEAAQFATFDPGDAWTPYGGMDAGELVRLMRSRRSCRNYRPEAVPRAVLDDLVKAGASAPSGTNSQRWTFSVLADRAAVERAGAAVGAFFRRLNALAERRWLRGALRLAGRPTLSDYYHSYYPTVQDAIRRHDTHGEDLLFHGAPAAIAVGARPGASCPGEDALLAAQNMLLTAHAVGLGTCLIGYVVEAARRDPRVLDALAMPHAETLHAVIALGWPDERWERCAGRRMPPVRYVGGEDL